MSTDDQQPKDSERVLAAVADGVAPLPRFSRKKDGFSRTDVVDAFQATFELVGGVPRLAQWANRNESEFYRLYAKLLPATTVHFGNAGIVQVIHRIAPTALDRHPDANGMAVDPQVIDAVMVKREPPDGD